MLCVPNSSRGCLLACSYYVQTSNSWPCVPFHEQPPLAASRNAKDVCCGQANWTRVGRRTPGCRGSFAPISTGLLAVMHHTSNCGVAIVPFRICRFGSTSGSWVMRGMQTTTRRTERSSQSKGKEEAISLGFPQGKKW
jgi:hypothetical protein